MTDVVPETEELGHDIPMDPTMERDESEQSEELEVGETLVTEHPAGNSIECDETRESFSENAEELRPVSPKAVAERTTSEPPAPAAVTFDWNAYLREHNAEPAPPECFFQPDVAPENKFQVGTKLMIADPRGPSGTSAMFCLGTVVNVFKLWLCVRIEGLDNSHEKWIFCDDDSIQPIGPTSEDHLKLNPPIGYVHHHGTFPKFLEQHLRANDETGVSMICPPEWFNPISETLRPTQNKFKVGQKVEAIDQRSFNGKTCPATIVEVTKTQIQIHFDGWNNGYDIKEPFYTRFVMPVGWSQKNGVEISPPKTSRKSGRIAPAVMVARQPVEHRPVQKADTKSESRQRYRLTTAKSSAQRRQSGSHNHVPSSASGATAKHPVVLRLSEMGVNPQQGIKRRRAKRSASSKSSTTTHPVSKKGTSKETPDPEAIRLAVERKSENTVEDKVKDLLLHAKVEQQKLAKQLSQPPMAYMSASRYTHVQPSIPSQYAQSSCSPDLNYAPIKNEAEEVVSSTTASVDTPHSPNMRLHSSRPSSSQASRDFAKVVGQIRPKKNREERGGSRSPASSSSLSHNAISPGSSALNPQRHDVLLLSKEEIPLKDRLMTIFVNYSCRIGPYLDPAMVAGIRRKFGPFATHHALREAVQQLLNCAKDDAVVINLVQPAAVTQILSVTAHCGGIPRSRFIPCVKSAADAWTYLKQLLRKMKVCENFYSNTGDPCTACEPTRDMAVDSVVAFSMPLKQWSIEKVACELRRILDDSIVAKFVEQQIDGRSLGLLTTELLMNYMGLALGPALNVIDFVKSVQKAQETQRASAVEVHSS